MSYVTMQNPSQPTAPQPCGCHRHRPGLGAFDFSSATFGAGTLAAIVALVLIMMLWKGKPAQTRRRKLAEARQDYLRRVAAIKAKYGRLGFQQADED